jgi:flagellar biosynthetic protein FliP
MWRLAALTLFVSPAWGAPQKAAGALKGALDTQLAPYGLPMQIVLLLTLLTVLPGLLISATPLLRITVVLHFLRQALGTQTAPSNQVLASLALLLTVIIMKPVAMESYTSGWQPFERGEVAIDEAWRDGSAPLKKFLMKYCREKDLQLLLEVSKTTPPANPSELDLAIVLPAYVLSELRTSFQIGAMLFLPFLIVDIVVASVTLSIGMVQLPPVMLSAPFKIFLFVLADGWNLVVGSLFRSFQTGAA